jgi:hypothetical protein
MTWRIGHFVAHCSKRGLTEASGIGNFLLETELVRYALTPDLVRTCGYSVWRDGFTVAYDLLEMEPIDFQQDVSFSVYVYAYFVRYKYQERPYYNWPPFILPPLLEHFHGR